MILVVIGSGPGGQRAAIQAAKCGKSVALVERQTTIGGTCINFGTIPSKTLREAVLHLSGFHYQNLYGVDYRVKKDITMDDLIFRVNRVVETEISVTQAQLQRNGIEMLHGTASFRDPNHIHVENSRATFDVSASNIIIATGTKPATSPKVPFNNRNICE